MTKTIEEDPIKIKKIKRWANASLILPVFGIIYDELENKIPENERTKSKKVNLYYLKEISTGILSGLFYAYIALGIAIPGWTPAQFKESLKRYREMEQEDKKTRDSVFNYVDENKDGILSNKERSKLESLMEIEDRSTNYVPAQNNWNKAYQNIQEIKEADSTLINNFKETFTQDEEN